MREANAGGEYPGWFVAKVRSQSRERGNRVSQWVVEVRRKIPATTIKALLNLEIVNDAVIANTSTPCRSLSLEALDVARERILLHGKQRVLNASLVFCRQFLTGELLSSFLGTQASDATILLEFCN